MLPFILSDTGDTIRLRIVAPLPGGGIKYGVKCGI